MGYSIDSVNACCYPGSTVLVNKYDIRDEEMLNKVETVLSSARYAEWESNPADNSFGFEHYKAIHRFLFSDLYDWAGKLRTIDISKKGTQFCNCADLESQAEQIFAHLADTNLFRGLEHDAFTEEIVDFYCATNYLHPFREGNGRTQRLFLTQLIRSAGYNISFANIDTELLMIGTIQAAHGVRDLLISLLSNAIYKDE